MGLVRRLVVEQVARRGFPGEIQVCNEAAWAQEKGRYLESVMTSETNKF